MVSPSSSKNAGKVDKFNVPKKVHYAMIASLVPALALCIAHGAVTGQLAPALGLIAQGFSAILALYRADLFRFKKASNQEYQILLPSDVEQRRKRALFGEAVLLAFADVCLLTGLIVPVVFTFLNGGVKCHSYYYRNYHNSWCESARLPMLAAYGTMVLLFNA
jgi:hypothetical protein